MRNQTKLWAKSTKTDKKASRLAPDAVFIGLYPKMQSGSNRDYILEYDVLIPLLKLINSFNGNRSKRF
jgi:hypothetical protein